MASGKKKEVPTSRAGATMNRKKKGEFDRLNTEIQNALDSAARVKKVGESALDSNEIVIIDANFKRGDAGSGYRSVIHTLLEWVNCELSSERIIVNSLDDDFYDGLLLAKLVDKLYGAPHLQAMPEVISSEAGQKQRVRAVLQTISEQMQIPEDRQAELPWSPALIYSRNEVALVRLLLALARHSCASVRLPDSLPVQLVIVQRLEGGVLQTVRQELDLAMPLAFVLARGETDAFDTLFEQTPEKIPQVTNALLLWLNSHLSVLGIVIDDLAQLSDGAYLVLLVGLLEGYFVPLYEYHIAPRAPDERAANVKLAIELLTDACVDLPVRLRPADIVNEDLCSIVRFLYHVFQFYSNRERERAYAATLQQPADNDDADYAEADTANCAEAEADAEARSHEDDDQSDDFLPPPEPHELIGAFQ